MKAPPRLLMTLGVVLMCFLNGCDSHTNRSESGVEGIIAETETLFAKREVQQEALSQQPANQSGITVLVEVIKTSSERVDEYFAAQTETRKEEAASLRMAARVWQKTEGASLVHLFVVHGKNRKQSSAESSSVTSLPHVKAHPPKDSEESNDETAPVVPEKPIARVDIKKGSIITVAPKQLEDGRIQLEIDLQLSTRDDDLKVPTLRQATSTLTVENGAYAFLDPETVSDLFPPSEPDGSVFLTFVRADSY